MKELLHILQQVPQFPALVQALETGQSPAAVSGLSRIHRAHFAAGLGTALDRPVVMVCADEDEAQTLGRDITAFTGWSVTLIGSREFNFYNGAVASHQGEHSRLAAFYAMAQGECKVITATVEGLLQRTLSPEELLEHVVTICSGGSYDPTQLADALSALGYTRCDQVEGVGQFALRGGILDFFSPAHPKPVRVEFFGDEIDRISGVNALTGSVIRRLNNIPVWPATHYVTPKEKMDAAIQEIYKELEERVAQFEAEGKLIEAQRIKQRTMYDIEMMQEIGYCSGIENYSRVIEGRPVGSPPHTLLDYFPKDFLLFVDESHVTLPQVRAMYNGDRARKTSLVDYGFRLPCAYDNRPLKFDEFETRLNQVVYVSATPGEYERERSGQIVEQVIRPTGLLDPPISVRPVEGQVTDLLGEIRARVERDERVLVTTLTKKMAEDLTDYLTGQGVKVKYMHHEVDTFERMELIRDLRMGAIDVIVGINLLREGLDLPEVSLVAILDADKEGFLRSETSLIQTIGRAARNAHGQVIMYADTVTPSMARAIAETEPRRSIQDAYNQEHGIVPKTVHKSVRELMTVAQEGEETAKRSRKLTDSERKATIARLEKEMKEAARMLEFELAAQLRDQIIRLKEKD